MKAAVLAAAEAGAAEAALEAGGAALGAGDALPAQAAKTIVALASKAASFDDDLGDRVMLWFLLNGPYADRRCRAGRSAGDSSKAAGDHVAGRKCPEA
ncbi:MAG TPA: hypothetical protein VIM30_05930 [Candidatus Limnocylindrales bacterium]